MTHNPSDDKTADASAPDETSGTRTASTSPRMAAARGRMPDAIGPYKILETLGEGGMGTVYLAEQTEPIRRRVALKVIKRGMDTKQVIARFETERQALALMDHPGVARVLDAGTTETGQPYFVMEHVAGVPITEHCDRHRLSINERLALFTQVCHAVQHAHQKGIIHRDIKPRNILVSVKEGEAVPKVIDFGVAKATQQRLTEKTLFTEAGQMVGTPSYMSPEQAEMTAQDVDTRSDIYSLGVLLYELLTGTLPLDPTSLRAAAFDKVLQLIREFDPPKPSTKLSDTTTGDAGTSTTAARARRTVPRTLVSALRGDLDWITMKALEKDRTRRYATATALAEDIDRHLKHVPVVAGPPGTGYRVRKFVRRNRAGVTAAVVVFVVLLAGVAGTTWQAVVARRQRDRAVAAERQQSRERERAEEARDDADAVTEYLIEWLTSVEPEEQGIDVTLREMLDQAAEKIGEKFADRPLIEARLRYTIGSTHLHLGLYDKAEEHFTEAAALYRREKGPRHPSTLLALNSLAVVLGNRGDYSAAAARHKATIKIQRIVLGDEHPDTLGSMHNLAVALDDQGKYAEAEALNRKTLEICRRVLGDEHPETLRSMNNLANALYSQGKYAEAEALHDKVLEIMRRVLGEEHPDTLRSMNNLAVSLKVQGKYAEAEALYDKVVEIMRRVLGEEHPDTLSSMTNFAHVLLDQGHYAQAEALHRKVLDIRRRLLGEEHPQTLRATYYLARAIYRQGNLIEARRIYQRILPVQRRVLGEEHPNTLDSMNNVAITLNALGKLAEAQKLHRKALAIRRRVLGEEHPRTLDSMSNLAVALNDQGKYAEAEALNRKTLEIRRRVLGEEHPNTLDSMNNLANALYSQGKYAEAEALHRKTLEIRRRVLGEEHPKTVGSMQILASNLGDQGKYAEARVLAEELIEHRRRRAEDPQGGPNNLNEYAYFLLTCQPADLRDPETALPVAVKAVEKTDAKNADILDTLALAYQMTGDIDMAVETQRKALALLPSDSMPVRIELEGSLGAYLVEQGNYAEAEPLLVDAHERMKQYEFVEPDDMKEALKRLVKLYKTWGKPEKAAEYRAMLPVDAD